MFAVITGSISGFILMVMGLETPSGKDIISNASRISKEAESIFVVSVNCRINIDTCSIDIDCTVSIPLRVLIRVSRGMETSLSTCSGVAPKWVVKMAVKGKSIAGSRSVEVFINDTTPKTITKITPTSTVKGFLTLNLSNIYTPSIP